MDVSTLRDLLTPSGQQAIRAALALAPREVDFLAHFQVLSRSYPADLARAALEIAILRLEAVTKFPFAEKLYLTREALEQASSYEVSAYRAARYRPFERIADLGCSVGADTLALAQVSPTTGIDHDPLRLAMARANLVTLALDERAEFVQADLNSPLPLSPGIALFFDPSRRSGGKRLFSVHDYRPPLSIVHSWTPRNPATGVKISPGVDLEELVPYDAEIEFISSRGELKEAVLWFGPLKTASRRATLLPGPHTLVAEAGLDRQAATSQPLAFIYEPDPAILRAGLVTTLGAQLGAAQLDPDIAYLTADALTATPFARAWRVEDWFPFGLKRLRAYLRARRVGRVTVKKRGSPLQPETLIRDLRLSGEAGRVVFLTHLRGRPIVIVAFDQEAN